MAKLYEFTIKLCGWGDDLNEAIENAKENFDIEDEPFNEYEIIDND